MALSACAADNAEKTLQAQVDAVYDRMTVEDRAAQLFGIYPSEFIVDGKFSIEKCREVIPYGAGHICQISSSQTLDADELRELVAAIQDYMVNETHAGIPAIMHDECISGLTAKGATVYPQQMGVACTWDPELTEAVGRAAGEEVRENNIGVWLAPAVNIHRNPLCGRNFEYFSEDPLLTGHLAGALVRGVQSNGVAATAKHLALNNKETNRTECDSRASERAIREIYLKAFEIIVKEYDVWSIMTSYNIINGHRASENADMLNGILRQEWGYEGMVTTDWWTHGEHYKECAAGNDVKMGCGYPERLLEALEKGVLTRDQMALAAKHILGMILKLD